MPSSNVAHINFGGINTSQLEYVDYSNPNTIAFSKETLELFNSIKKETISLFDFICNFMIDSNISKQEETSKQIESIKNLFEQATLP